MSKITNKVPKYKSLQEKSLIVTKNFIAINLYCNEKKFVVRCCDKVCGNRILQ